MVLALGLAWIPAVWFIVLRLGLNLAGKPPRGRTKIPEILDMCSQFRVLKRQMTWTPPDSSTNTVSNVNKQYPTII